MKNVARIFIHYTIHLCDFKSGYFLNFNEILCPKKYFQYFSLKSYVLEKYFLIE